MVMINGQPHGTQDDMEKLDNMFKLYHEIKNFGCDIIMCNECVMFNKGDFYCKIINIYRALMELSIHIYGDIKSEQIKEYIEDDKEMLNRIYGKTVRNTITLMGK